jgi:hypothetical protein
LRWSVKFRVTWSRRHRSRRTHLCIRQRRGSRRDVTGGTRMFVLGVAGRVIDVINSKFTRLDSFPT